MNAAGTLVGTQLGSYEVQSLLGSGGMAHVYRGFDHNLHRTVAIKVLAEAAATQPGVAARFQQEARFIARLHHPQIVRVYDYGEANGRAYIVQELLPGPTLAQEIADRQARGVQFTRDEVVDAATQLASALEAAHAAGIIHRDVKPTNVIRNAQHQLVLTDFGIARATQPDVAHTQTGTVVGTPDYISPEQAQGREPTFASDIYALGVVLYELLCGKRPFVAGTPMGVLLGHIQDQPPPLRSLRPDLPLAVEDVVLRALAKDPAQRFGSAGDFARALEQAWRSGASAAVHTLPTTSWVPPAPAQAPGVHAEPTQVVSPPVAPVPQAARPPANRPPPVTAANRPRSRMLPLLGSLLVLLALAGAALAFRSGENTPTTGPLEAPTGVPAASVATATPEPTAALAEPTPLPTSLPEPTPEPTPEPPTSEPPPAAPAEPIDELRALLASDRDGEAFLKRLDEFERELAKGDTDQAGKKLRELRDKLQEDGSREIAAQAGPIIEQIAAAYSLDLDKSSGGKGKGKDKDD